MLQQIHASKISGWHKRRFWQVVHSIPHYIAELRDIDSLREAIDCAYFKNPYLFKLRKYPPRATVEFTNHCNFGCGYCPRSLMDATSFEKQRKGGKYSEIRKGAFGFAGHKSKTKPIFEVRHVISPNENSADLRAFKRIGCNLLIR